MAQKTTAKQTETSKHDELILVVKRQHLFPEQAFNGLRAMDMNACMKTITENQDFQPRGIMETDTRYKQIIPYCVFQHGDKYFFMQRAGKASEQRLQNKFSFGIGGHIRQEDMDGATIFDWAKREFHEEINYNGNLTVEPLGLLNDDTNEVGKVHIGLVLLLKGDSSEISIKSELQNGQLLTLKQCAPYLKHMESWSKIVYAFLCTQNT